MKLDALVAIDVQKAFVNDAVSHVPGEVDDAIDHVAQTSGRIYTPTCVQGDAGEPAPTDRPASPVQGSANAETALDAAADTTEIERTDHRVIGPALVATLEDPAIGRIGVCGIDTGGNVTGAVVDLVDAGLDTHLLAWASGSHAGAEEWERTLAALEHQVGRDRIWLERPTADTTAADEEVYTCLVRPATILGSLPPGVVLTDWSKVPADLAGRFADKPVSDHRHGEFRTSRRLTPAERTHFSISVVS